MQDITSITNNYQDVFPRGLRLTIYEHNGVSHAKTIKKTARIWCTIYPTILSSN